MKTILTSETVSIPENVSISLSHKDITVTGPQGTERRSFTKNQLEFEVTEAGRTLVVRCWLGDKKTRAMVGTAAGHVRNMITGVVAGYKLGVQAIYKHFPIIQYTDKNHKFVELRNVMDTKRIRHVDMVGNTLYLDAPNGPRDLRYLQGTNLEDVTHSAMRLMEESKDDMKRDPVKFIDGLYRTELTSIQEGYRKERKTRRKQHYTSSSHNNPTVTATLSA